MRRHSNLDYSRREGGREGEESIHIVKRKIQMIELIPDDEVLVYNLLIELIPEDADEVEEAEHARCYHDFLRCGAVACLRGRQRVLVLCRSFSDMFILVLGRF